MSRFLGRRLIRAVLTVWAVATLVFLLMHALPGDVVLVLLDTVGAGSPAAEKMREFLGLDRPLYVQYFDWLGDLLRGDMGNSLLGGYPVWDLVKSRIPVTVELAALTILLGLSIAIPLGIVAAARNGSWVDLLAMQFGQLGYLDPELLDRHDTDSGGGGAAAVVAAVRIQADQRRPGDESAAYDHAFVEPGAPPGGCDDARCALGGS